MAGYWVVRIEVTDMEPYLTYAKQTADVAAQFGGRFLVKGGAMEQKEGSGPERIVLIEFPSEGCHSQPFVNVSHPSQF